MKKTAKIIGLLIVLIVLLIMAAVTMTVKYSKTANELVAIKENIEKPKFLAKFEGCHFITMNHGQQMVIENGNGEKEAVKETCFTSEGYETIMSITNGTITIFPCDWVDVDSTTVDTIKIRQKNVSISWEVNDVATLR